MTFAAVMRDGLLFACPFGECKQKALNFYIEVMRSHDHYRLECMNNICHVTIISGLLSNPEDNSACLEKNRLVSPYKEKRRTVTELKSVCLVVGLVIRIFLLQFQSTMVSHF